MWPLSFELTLSLGRALIMVLALLTLAWGFNHWRHSAARDAQRMFEQLDLIRAELMLLTDRVQGLEVQAPPVQERPAAPEVRAPSVANVNVSAPRGYEVAARLARGGATCEELISSCGLSRHEAELLIRLHKAETARNKPAVTPTPAKTTDERRARLAAVV